MAEGLSEDQMSQEMLATRKREPRTMAAIWTFSMTVREMACHCSGFLVLIARTWYLK